MANSSMFVRPISTASAALSRATTVASYGGRKFSSIREAQVVSARVAEHVLHRDRQARQRPERFAATALGVDRGGLGQSAVGVDAQEGADFAVVPVDAIEERLRHFRRSASPPASTSSSRRRSDRQATSKRSAVSY